jgi:hypothetical protein
MISQDTFLVNFSAYVCPQRKAVKDNFQHLDS